MNIKKFNLKIKEMQKEEDEIERLSDVDMNEIQMYFDKPLDSIHEVTYDEGNILEGMSW